MEEDAHVGSETNFFEQFRYNGPSVSGGGLVTKKRPLPSCELLKNVNNNRRKITKRPKTAKFDPANYVQNLVPVTPYFRLRFAALEKRGLSKRVLQGQKNERGAPAREHILFEKIRVNLDSNPLAFYGKFISRGDTRCYTDPTLIEANRDEAFAIWVKMKNGGRHANRIVFVENGKFFNAYGVEGLLVSDLLDYNFVYTNGCMGVPSDGIQGAINILLDNDYEMVMCKKKVLDSVNRVISIDQVITRANPIYISHQTKAMKKREIEHMSSSSSGEEDEEDLEDVFRDSLEFDSENQMMVERLCYIAIVMKPSYDNRVKDSMCHVVYIDCFEARARVRLNMPYASAKSMLAAGGERFAFPLRVVQQRCGPDRDPRNVVTPSEAQSICEPQRPSYLDARDTVHIIEVSDSAFATHVKTAIEIFAINVASELELEGEKRGAWLASVCSSYCSGEGQSFFSREGRQQVHQALPLNAPSAAQLGITSLKTQEGIISVLPYILSPSHTCQSTKNMIVNWILRTPPHEVALSISRACRELGECESCIPSMRKPDDWGRASSLFIHDGVPSVPVIYRFHSLFKTIIEIHEDENLARLVDYINPIVAYEIGSGVELVRGMVHSMKSLVEIIESHLCCEVEVLNSVESRGGGAATSSSSLARRQFDAWFHDRIAPEHMKSSRAGQFGKVPHELFMRNECTRAYFRRSDGIEGTFRDIEAAATGVRDAVEAIPGDSPPEYSKAYETLFYRRDDRDIAGYKAEEKVKVGTSTNKNVNLRICTFDSVKREVDRYLFAVQKMHEEESEVLLRLKHELTDRSIHIHAALHFVTVLETLYGHVVQCKKSGWCHPSVQSDPEARDIEIRGFFPFWIDKQRARLNNLEGFDRPIVLTGVHASGKSTVLRSLFTNAKLATCGLMAPCEEATVPFFDFISIRTAATDNPASGDSGMDVESKHIKTIETHITGRSLVFIDELGRGTSPECAVAISAAMLNKITDRNARAVVATHFHDLFKKQGEFADLFRFRERIECMRMTPDAHRWEKGKCMNSDVVRNLDQNGVSDAFQDDVENILRRYVTINSNSSSGNTISALTPKKGADEICGSQSTTKCSVSLTLTPSVKEEEEEEESKRDDDAICCSIKNRDDVDVNTIIKDTVNDVKKLIGRETTKYFKWDTNRHRCPIIASSNVSVFYILHFYRRTVPTLYIGTTNNLIQRMEKHKRSKDPNFYAHVFIVDSENAAKQFETNIIQKLHPYYNLLNDPKSDGRHSSFGATK